MWTFVTRIRGHFKRSAQSLKETDEWLKGLPAIIWNDESQVPTWAELCPTELFYLQFLFPYNTKRRDIVVLFMKKIVDKSLTIPREASHIIPT